MLNLIEIEFLLYKLLMCLPFIFSKLLIGLSFIFSKLLIGLSFIFSNPIILIGFCLFFIFLIPSKEKLKIITFKKKLFFYFVLLMLVLLLFEVTLSLGGYFYFYVYSNLDRPKIEEDAFRILFLGESTTAGAYVNGEEAYAAQVEKSLQQRYPGKKIKSYNKGIGSIETTAILRNLDRNMIKYKPHLVIIMAGSNDSPVLDNKSSKFKIFYSKLKLYRLMTLVQDFYRLAKIYNYELGGDTIYIWNDDYRYKPLILLSEVTFNLNEIIRTVHSYNSEIGL